jgi:hypothetical protein
MKKLAIVHALFGFVFLAGLGTGLRVHAQSVKEKSIDVDGSVIQVKVLGVNADVVSVKPYIKAKQGKKEGDLWLDVAIKNTGSEPQAYNIFGQGKTNSGGWRGGALKVPKEGKIEPDKEATAKVKTGYKGETVPKEIRVEILPPE